MKIRRSTLAGSVMAYRFIFDEVEVTTYRGMSYSSYVRHMSTPDTRDADFSVKPYQDGDGWWVTNDGPVFPTRQEAHRWCVGQIMARRFADVA